MRLRADRRVERQQEATERNTAWQKLSKQEQINSLADRRGRSIRQIKKLDVEAGKKA